MTRANVRTRQKLQIESSSNRKRKTMATTIERLSIRNDDTNSWERTITTKKQDINVKKHERNKTT